jgi:hypothetical protein
MRLAQFKRSGVPTAIIATVAVVTVCLLFLGLSDADIAARFLRIGSQPNDPTLVVHAAATAIRILLVTAMVLLALTFVLIFARQDAPVQPTSSGPAQHVVTHAAGLQLAVDALGSSKVTELHIWGFSLQWATPLYRHLRQRRRECLVVRLYVAGEPAWSSIVDYKSVDKNALSARRESTILEWLTLSRDHMVAAVHVYLVNQLPNDKGVLVGDELALLGTYDFYANPAGGLSFTPQPGEERLFLVADSASTQYSQLLLRWAKRRVACRQFDADEITEHYTQP